MRIERTTSCVRSSSIALAMVASLVASPARAEGDDVPPPRATRLATPWLAVEALARMESIPALDSMTEPGAIRGSDAKWPAPGSVLLAGAGAGVGITWGSWVLPLFHLEAAIAVGPSPRVVTALDGSIAELHPWTTRYVAADVFGIGVRTKLRRWMLEAILEPGVAIVWMDAQIASGRTASELHAAAVSLSLRGTVEVCRRLDPTNRACLAFEPSIYELGFFGGGAVALRWEVGP